MGVMEAIIKKTKQWVEQIGSGKEVEKITSLPNQTFRIKRTDGENHTFRLHSGLIQQKLPTVGWVNIKSLNL